VPSWDAFALTMLGLALACGGASALNHYLDRDIDRLMGSRTETRPVASGRVPAARALEFGLALSAFSFVLLDSLVNLPTALLALGGNLFYVVVYTRLLKRSTPQNIVIGGAAGAVPPLVGYAGASGRLGMAALVMFAVVFVWTPPHFWALALMLKEHYARARVPMLPVTRGDRETARQILWYTAVLVAVTLAPVALGTFGVVYGVAAALLGAAFLWLAVELRRTMARAAAVRLFHFSLLYLALLFVAMALDVVV
jgi:protoheme IX farnesyltransferase